MAENLVKITILFVTIYQVMQLCQASPSPLPLPQEIPNPLDYGNQETPISDTNEPPSPQETPIPDTNEPPSPQETPIPDTNEPPSPQETPIPSDTNEPQNLTPTDPMDLNKMGFSPLLHLYGKLGPLIYTLLTDENGLGEQMSVVSKIIADRIGIDDFKEDMDLIFSNALNPKVSEKILDVYNKIKDIEVQGTVNRKLQDAVEIITNIANDDEAVDKIIDIIKTSKV